MTEQTMIEEVQETEEFTTEVVTVVDDKPKRVRRVTSDVTLPVSGSNKANIALDVAGIDTIINYEVDFSTMDESFIYQAALAGMVNRLGIAYSGLTDPDEIKQAIEEELSNFGQGKFISRSASERAVKAPDIVIAWIRAVNKNPEDRATLAEYMGGWRKKSDEEKAKIKSNELVATIFEQMQYEKRMARVEQEGNDDESVLAI